MKKIFYIGFYGDESLFNQNRYLALSAVNKMNYIINKLVNIGYKVEIISPAWIKKSDKIEFSYKIGQTKSINTNISFSIPFSFDSKYKLFYYISMFYSFFWLVLNILIKVKSNDVIVVYHSVFYIRILNILKKIKKFKLILEVEEVYSKVFEVNKKNELQEINFIKKADGYLLSNDLMVDKLQLDKEKATIIYGIYEPNEIIKSNYLDINDGKIHLVYSGIIDRIKLGAFNAVNVAGFLSDCYVIHILGFGLDSDIKELIQLIEETNKNSQCKVYFHGKLIGKEYDKFLNSCHIGLSTQINEGDYLNYTFPSKVLSYLTLGLRVVTAEMECLTKSKISDLLYFYKEDNPKSIAECIKKIILNDKYEVRKTLDALDRQFYNDLKKII